MPSNIPPQSGAQTIVALLPALNEAEAIGPQVRAMLTHPALCALPLARVLVVDNGSDDATAEVARAAGADVVREPRRGYGRACLTGVLTARDADILLLLDADGSDDLAGAAAVAQLVLCGAADLAVGSRVRGQCDPGALTTQQRLGNALAATLLRMLCGARVTDLGPVRAIRREALLALDPHEMTYGWSTEMLLKAARAGYRLAELPVDYHQRAGGVSKVSGTVWGTLRAGWTILATIARHACWRPASPSSGQARSSGLAAATTGTTGGDGA